MEIWKIWSTYILYIRKVLNFELDFILLLFFCPIKRKIDSLADMHAYIYFYPAVTVTATITVWPVSHYCTTFLRKPRDLPFPFSARLHAAFGSLSSPDRTRSRAVRARSDQGAHPDHSDSGRHGVK